jgi:hypothetical protein
MAGMRALGRLYDVVLPDAAATGAVVSMKNCSGVGIVAVCATTASSTLTLTAGKVYGTYSAAGITTFPPKMYSRVALGTAAWTDDSSGLSWVTSTGVGTIAGATAADVYYLDFLGSYLADGYDYLKVVPSADLQIMLLPYDLTVQRIPTNLQIIAE